jgi:Co/Zn/Cd efflux system component
MCAQLEGVFDVHDLHVWNLSLGLPILSAHVNVDADAQADAVSDMRGGWSFQQ